MKDVFWNIIELILQIFSFFKGVDSAIGIVFFILFIIGSIIFIVAKNDGDPINGKDLLYGLILTVFLYTYAYFNIILTEEVSSFLGAGSFSIILYIIFFFTTPILFVIFFVIIKSIFGLGPPKYYLTYRTDIARGKRLRVYEPCSHKYVEGIVVEVRNGAVHDKTTILCKKDRVYYWKNSRVGQNLTFDLLHLNGLIGTPRVQILGSQKNSLRNQIRQIF